MGGHIASCTPEMDVAFKKGDIISNAIPKEAFLLNGDLEGFGIETLVILEGGREVSAGDIIRWDAEFGNTYEMVLSDRGGKGEDYLSLNYE